MELKFGLDISHKAGNVGVTANYEVTLKWKNPAEGLEIKGEK
jgi:hypothetical protein